MAFTGHEEDGGFTSIPSKGTINASRQQRNRIYIGNLPVLHQNELQEIVASRLDLPTSSITVVNHQSQQNSATIAIAGINAETAVISLRGLQARGKKLVVHRDNTTSRGNTTVKSTHGTQPSFGSWTKPKKDSLKEESKETGEETPLNRSGEALLSIKNVAEPISVPNANSDDATENCDSTTTPDFATLRQNPLSKLLEEYGEEDPDWMSQEPTDDKVGPTLAETTTSTPTAAVASLETTNRLQRHGMAPIHVEFVSFGYRHGIPFEVRENATGHSHRQPLVAFDSRASLEEVPHYLAWMDGLSGAVKNTMIRHRPNSGVGRGNKDHFRAKSRRSDRDATATNASPNRIEPNEAKASSAVNVTFLNVRDYARDVVAVPVADAVEVAMAEHGYADPLNMTIYIGSEQGRHRSVVAAEQAATALRKLLRENAENRFSCTVSVGCRHRDIDRKNHKVSASKTSVTARVTKNRTGVQIDDDE